jgi:hypothetical protein
MQLKVDKKQLKGGSLLLVFIIYLMRGGEK